MASLEYFAGFFDGEGSCGIYRVRNKPQIPVFRVSLCNNDPRPLQEAHVQFGGTVRPRLRTQRGKTTCNYEWYIYGKNADVFLKSIRPFTVIKSEQIDKFLSARLMLVGSGNRRTAESDRAIREAETILKTLKRC